MSSANPGIDYSAAMINSANATTAWPLNGRAQGKRYVGVRPKGSPTGLKNRQAPEKNFPRHGQAANSPSVPNYRFIPSSDLFCLSAINEQRKPLDENIRHSGYSVHIKIICTCRPPILSMLCRQQWSTRPSNCPYSVEPSSQKGFLPGIGARGTCEHLCQFWAQQSLGSAQTNGNSCLKRKHTLSAVGRPIGCRRSDLKKVTGGSTHRGEYH